ncbi:TetR/AcrR family transcriptional regulator [Paenibacillus yanchengensis]|uniref:TetR/AcrR family transcriptional regulator n=1 Tax=Paenibacillus yanchengensis TaxID=2035833 RepID=A0ABW4YMJ9_9BACL
MNKRKKMVIEHALAIFIENGIQQTSIQHIIERARISKGTFYNYFSSKNDCIGAIIEQIRYEASLSRSDLLIGKNVHDLSVLVHQVSVIAKMNANRGLPTLIEEMLHSGDPELKKLVLRFRLFEIEWLADRLTDVFGESLRPYALEAATIFFGINQHLFFTSKIINQTDLDPLTVATTVFHYMESITHSLIHERTAVLDYDKLDSIRTHVQIQQVSSESIIELLQNILANEPLTHPQRDLTEALQAELQLTPLRKSVITALLHPFMNALQDSDLLDTAKEICTLITIYIND